MVRRCSKRFRIIPTPSRPYVVSCDVNSKKEEATPNLKLGDIQRDVAVTPQ